MLYLYSTEPPEKIASILASVEGLTEATRIETPDKLKTGHVHLVIEQDTVRAPLPWHNLEPPIVFEAVPATAGNVLALALVKLGYVEEALPYSNEVALNSSIQCMQQVMLGGSTAFAESVVGNGYAATHNQAVLLHYTPGHFYSAQCEATYRKALTLAPDAEHAAFTAMQLAVYLYDHGKRQEALNLLSVSEYPVHDLPEAARFGLSREQINIQFEQLAAPYDFGLVEELKGLIRQAVTWYENQGPAQAVAGLLVQASGLTNIEKSYTESLQYITRAISIYKAEDLPELLVPAHMRKGTLLYTWAQDGNPQFYMPAVDAYKEALRLTTEEEAPDVHAEAHHHMAMIYAEMPGNDRQKAIWVTTSANAFAKCLHLYKEAGNAYDYAMAANNYGNALLKYPQATTYDNAEKAISYYQQALAVRNAEQYPLERAHTLLNYVEACWRVHNVNEIMERLRRKDMIVSAREVKQLTTDEDLIARAQEHLDRLIMLPVN